MSASDLVLTAAKQKLAAAATAFAKAPDAARADAWQQLATAAHVFSRTADGRGGSTTPKAHSLVTMPFGRHAGKPLEDIEESDLRWALAAVEKSIADPAKKHFRQKNEELADAIEAELEERS